MSILDSVLGRREPAAAYRTIDGGHPAPYPDMSDEQLYNYEMAFNVPRKTFDKPPRSAIGASHAARFEPALGPRVQESDGAPEKRFFAIPEQQETAWRHTMSDVPESSVPPANEEAQPRENAVDTAEQTPWAGSEQGWKSRVAPDDGKPLDLTKPVRTITTRQPVEIITTRARHSTYKVHGYIGDDDIATVFTLDGRLSENGAQFLENVPEEHELYLNIYPNDNNGSKDRYVITQHETREEADADASAGRIVCIRADFKC